MEIKKHSFKNFKFILIALTIFFSLSSVLAGEKENKNPIDRWLDKCLEKKQSTQGMVECYNEATDMWDRELNKVYKNLMKNLKPNERKLLRESQRRWIKYRDKEFEFLNTFPFVNNNRYKYGTMSFIMVAAQKMQVVKDRVLELESFLNFINFSNPNF